METLVANLAGKTRREKLDGRDYLVAPVRMIVPGVLNGSQGPLLYELSDIAASAEAWNGMPIMLNHPMEKGKSISARNPKVFDKFGLGHVYNSIIDGNLAAEGWFDIQKITRVAPTLLSLIENGHKVELSTGLRVDREPKTGEYNGVVYTGVARNYKPDHLAILLDSKGACSVQDGCGVNNEEDVDNAFCPTGPGGGSDPTCSPRGKGKSGGAILGGGGGTPGEKYAAAAQKAKASSDAVWKSSGEPGATTKPGLKKREKLARQAAKDHKAAYKLSTASADKDFHDSQALEFESAADRLLDKYYNTRNQETEMSHEATVNELITNCSCTFKEADRETLTNMDPAMLAKCKDYMGKMAKNEIDLNAKVKSLEEELKTAKEELAAKPKQEPTTNKKITFEDLPDEYKTIVNRHNKWEKDRKTQLINKLVANIDNEEAKKAQVERLSKRPLEDLEADVALLPSPQEQTANQFGREQFGYEPDYSGQAVGNSQGGGNKTKIKPLGLPTMNFSARQEAKKQTA